MSTKYKFDHIALNVENIDRAVEWYKNKLNANVKYKDNTWAMLEIGSTNIALTLPSQHPPHVAFSVENIDNMPNELIKEHRDGSKYV
jgi:catechol 2,3-dioxygenase-like lactoylglutathione lyase family enzyme